MIESAFIDATAKGPYSYLLIDFRPETNDILRVRTGIFLGDEYIVYINKNMEHLIGKYGKEGL